MALVNDPDNLSQGATTSPSDLVTSGATGATITFTGTASLPALDAGMFFEVRDHSDSENNGLYVESGGTPTTSSITADKLTGANPVNNAVGEAARFLGRNDAIGDEKSVHYDTDAREMWLLEQGNLSVDGVLSITVYSKYKLDWKADADLIKHPNPMIAVTPEQFEFVDDWNLRDDAPTSVRSRKLMRTGGWSEIAETTDVLLAQWASIITLGLFEDSVNDTAYYYFGSDATDLTAAVDFDFAGPVNEAVQVFQGNVVGPDITPNGLDFTDGGGGDDSIDRNDGGSFITDGFVVGGQVDVRLATTGANNGTYTITSVAAASLGIPTASITADTDDNAGVLDINNRNLINVRLRIRDADPNGKTFDASNNAGIGVTGPDAFNNRTFRFPLANGEDLKISATDAAIDGGGPWDQIVIKYFDQAFNREVDTATNRDFGIAVDVGTHSGVDGSFTVGLSVLTTTEGGITGADFTGGTVRIHEGADENTTFSISGTPTATTVTITGTFTATESNISFTLQRATPIVATAEQIYEKIQRQLRRDLDIDDTDQVVVGRTADELLAFSGENLRAGEAIPSNPNAGGSGVIIEGFDSNDTNRLFFFDNTGVSRNFPFVAAGSMTFNANLVNDLGPAEFFMFFEYTERFTNTGFGISAPTGNTATLDSSVTNLVTELADQDYIKLDGFADAADNGIWQLTAAPGGAGPWTAAVRKVKGNTVAVEAAGASVSLDKNPYKSPDAILVDDNAAADITGTIGASSIAFDFDYDNNVQGGRTSGTDANIVVVALGEELADHTETFGVITRAVGLVFAVVAPLERNFSNP